MNAASACTATIENSGGERRLNIRPIEVIALEEQGRAKLLREGIGEAIAKIEPGWRTPPKSNVGRKGDR